MSGLMKSIKSMPILLISKMYLAILGDQSPDTYIHVASHARRIDPEHVVTNRIQAATDRFCKLLETQLRLPEKGPGDGAHYFASAGKTTANAVAKTLATEPLVSEPAIAADLIELLPDGWGAFGGSSMPIRDLDTYAKTTSPRTTPLAVELLPGGAAFGHCRRLR